MATSQWCSILRNAIAHGGIAYLNENGRSSYGEPVKMGSSLFQVGELASTSPAMR